MFKTIPIIVMATLCLIFNAKAQENKAIDVILKGIQIGQQVPDITITNLHNYIDKEGKPATTAKLSDFRGKLLILDFWATWCRACIGNFPKIGILANRYVNDMKVIMVTSEDRTKVTSFFDKRDTPPKEIILTNDSLFKSMFPHSIIPHYVWIDKNGIFLGATDDQDVTTEKIAGILSEGAELVHLKKDMDRSIPLYSADLPLNKTLHYSVLVKGYNPGLPSGTKDIMANKAIIGKAITNASYYDIYYMIAYGLFGATDTPPYPSSAVFKISDQTQFKKQYFNYEFRTTTTSAKELYLGMLTELDRYSPYHVVFKKEKRPFLALVVKNRKWIPISDSINPKAKNLRRVISRLNKISVEMPIVDETGLKDNVKIALPKGVADIKSAKIELATYGLDLVEKRKEMYRFILTEKQEKQIEVNAE